jgi:hypothetical protein
MLCDVAFLVPAVTSKLEITGCASVRRRSDRRQFITNRLGTYVTTQNKKDQGRRPARVTQARRREREKKRERDSEIDSERDSEREGMKRSLGEEGRGSAGSKARIGPSDSGAGTGGPGPGADITPCDVWSMGKAGRAAADRDGLWMEASDIPTADRVIVLQVVVAAGLVGCQWACPNVAAESTVPVSLLSAFNSVTKRHGSSWGRAHDAGGDSLGVPVHGWPGTLTRRLSQ